MCMVADRLELEVCRKRATEASRTPMVLVAADARAQSGFETLLLEHNLQALAANSDGLTFCKAPAPTPPVAVQASASSFASCSILYHLCYLGQVFNPVQPTAQDGLVVARQLAHAALLGRSHSNPHCFPGDHRPTFAGTPLLLHPDCPHKDRPVLPPSRPQRCRQDFACVLGRIRHPAIPLFRRLIQFSATKAILQS